jgi:hypothetical protein
MLRVFLRPSKRWHVQIAATRQFSSNFDKEFTFMDSFARKLGSKNDRAENNAKSMIAQLKPEAAKKAKDLMKEEKTGKTNSTKN